MASAPSEPRPVLGRVDALGRLISADPELAQLQLEAGSRVGALLALPQIAAIAHLARKLGVAVSRRAVAAGADRDLDLWVTATPHGDDVVLAIDGWTERPASGPRLSHWVGISAGEQKPTALGEWSADGELRLLSLSPDLAERLGIDLMEAVGQPLTRMLKLEEDEDGAMPLLAAVAARHSFAGQQAKVRKSGETLLFSGEVVTGADGGFAGFTGYASLETAASVPIAGPQGTIEDGLDEALRSPLDRIIDCAERIVERSDGPLRSDYAAYANDIAAAAKHLLSVIGGMGEELAAGPGAVDLAALSAEAVSMFESASEERGVTVELESSGPQLVNGEERAVLQILINLIGNAVRYSPEGGKVSIQFDRSGSTGSVTVVDRGPGIDPADQQRIFERFERADEDDGGTGLGLAIALRLARSMGGDIDVDSTPGAGARFMLSLPVA